VLHVREGRRWCASSPPAAARVSRSQVHDIPSVVTGRSRRRGPGGPMARSIRSRACRARRAAQGGRNGVVGVTSSPPTNRRLRARGGPWVPTWGSSRAPGEVGAGADSKGGRVGSRSDAAARNARPRAVDRRAGRATPGDAPDDQARTSRCGRGGRGATTVVGRPITRPPTAWGVQRLMESL